MTALEVDQDLLTAFERGFDPRHPDRGVIPARVLGYGEISTVLEIQEPGLQGLACKRMPMFRHPSEIERFLGTYQRYIETLRGAVGLELVPDQAVMVQAEPGGRPVLYILQQQVSSEAIGNQVIRRLPEREVVRLVEAVMDELGKVFDFNRAHRAEIELGFDGQISNWAIRNLDPSQPALPATLQLVYFDTSTPLLRQDGEEQLDPQLFLRSAPSFLVWILRLLFLEDVMTRYYDLRRVALDLVANFHKEGRPELVPILLEAVNPLLAKAEPEAEPAPITVREVGSYYREDAWIWRLYLAFRKIDRALHQLLRKDYPYVLPDKIHR